MRCCSLLVVFVCLLVAGTASAAEGVVPDEVSLYWLTVVEDAFDWGDAWKGMGGRLDWQLIGPLLLEVDFWTTGSNSADEGASGGAISGRLLLEGLISGVFARGGLARYRGRTSPTFGGGIEFYLVKKISLRGEISYLRPEQGGSDLGLSLGVGFRL